MGDYEGLASSWVDVRVLEGLQGGDLLPGHLDPRPDLGLVVWSEGLALHRWDSVEEVDPIVLEVLPVYQGQHPINVAVE